MKPKKFENNAVAEVFKTYPVAIRKKLLLIRQLIFDTSSKLDNVGELEETLKWGEPSYLTKQSKGGSTIRLGWKKSQKDQYAIYFNCHTTLVDTFKEIYGDLFKYSGNRSIFFNKTDDIPWNELAHCITMSLTYHFDRKKQQPKRRCK